MSSGLLHIEPQQHFLYHRTSHQAVFPANLPTLSFSSAATSARPMRLRASRNSSGSTWAKLQDEEGPLGHLGKD